MVQDTRRSFSGLFGTLRRDEGVWRMWPPPAPDLIIGHHHDFGEGALLFTILKTFAWVMRWPSPSSPAVRAIALGPIQPWDVKDFLRPGRGRASSPPTANTTGIAVVAALAASAAAPLAGVTITLIRRRTRSAASSANR